MPSSVPPNAPVRHDLVIRGGTVYDGGGGPGAVADVAVTGERVLDLPTAIHREGIRVVYVNGVAVARDGRHTGARPGRAVRRA